MLHGMPMLGLFPQCRFDLVTAGAGFAADEGGKGRAARARLLRQKQSVLDEKQGGQAGHHHGADDGQCRDSRFQEERDACVCLAGRGLRVDPELRAFVTSAGPALAVRHWLCPLHLLHSSRRD